MNHDQFTYWLQGFVEMNGGKEPNQWQWRMIKDHLQTCFVKVTPTYPPMPVKPPYVIGGSFGGDIKIKKSGGGGGC